MQFNKKDFKKVEIILLVAIFLIFLFFLLKPFFTAIVGGFILAYIFTPLYRKINSKIPYPTISAFIVSAIILIAILIPIWFVLPTITQQIFEMFSSLQSIDFGGVIKYIFPVISNSSITQTVNILNSFLNNMNKILLDVFIGVLLGVPSIILHFAIVVFIFFFTLRDGERFTHFMGEISPFSRAEGIVFVSQFKEITNSIIYGNIVVGIVQGLVAGIGFWIFGIHNAIALTFLAVFFSMIPTIGAFVVWIPANIYLFMNTSPLTALLFLIYNLLITSTIDNIIRAYIVASKAHISQAIIVVGMIAGVSLFGLIGIVIGALAVSYFVILLRAYRDRTFHSLLHENKTKI